MSAKKKTSKPTPIGWRIFFFLLALGMTYLTVGIVLCGTVGEHADTSGVDFSYYRQAFNGERNDHEWNLTYTFYVDGEKYTGTSIWHGNRYSPKSGSGAYHVNYFAPYPHISSFSKYESLKNAEDADDIVYGGGIMLFETLVGIAVVFLFLFLAGVPLPFFKSKKSRKEGRLPACDNTNGAYAAAAMPAQNAPNQAPYPQAQAPYPQQQAAQPPHPPQQGAYPPQQPPYPPQQAIQPPYPQQQGGYPPQQPPYPPQQPPYPPQQVAYPPQQGAYAPQQPPVNTYTSNPTPYMTPNTPNPLPAGVGYSERLYSPEFQQAVAKRKKQRRIWAIVLIVAIIVVVPIVSYFSEDTPLSTGFLLSFVIAAIVGAGFWIYSLFHRQGKPWEGVVEKKYTEDVISTKTSADEGRQREERYRVRVRRDNGKKHIIDEERFRNTAYKYFEVGDRLRYLPNMTLAFPYEKFDKSGDTEIICVFCGKKNDIHATHCKACRLPLLN